MPTSGLGSCWASGLSAGFVAVSPRAADRKALASVATSPVGTRPYSSAPLGTRAAIDDQRDAANGTDSRASRETTKWPPTAAAAGPFAAREAASVVEPVADSVESIAALSPSTFVRQVRAASWFEPPAVHLGWLGSSRQASPQVLRRRTGGGEDADPSHPLNRSRTTLEPRPCAPSPPAPLPRGALHKNARLHKNPRGCTKTMLAARDCVDAPTVTLPARNRGIRPPDGQRRLSLQKMRRGHLTRCPR